MRFTLNVPGRRLSPRLVALYSLVVRTHRPENEKERGDKPPVSVRTPRAAAAVPGPPL